MIQQIYIYIMKSNQPKKINKNKKNNKKSHNKKIYIK